MNPGLVEETGKTAQGIVKAMASQPVMLGMVTVNLAMIALLWLTLKASSDARKTGFELIFKQQSEALDLLSRCVVQPSTRGGIDIPLPPPRPQG